MPSHVDVEERVARVPLLPEMPFDQVWTFCNADSAEH